MLGNSKTEGKHHLEACAWERGWTRKSASERMWERCTTREGLSGVFHAAFCSSEAQERQVAKGSRTWKTQIPVLLAFAKKQYGSTLACRWGQLQVNVSQGPTHICGPLGILFHVNGKMRRQIVRVYVCVHARTHPQGRLFFSWSVFLFLNDKIFSFMK